MEIVQITKEEFDAYAEKHKSKNFYQTSSYGMLMDRHSFDDYYLALKDEGTIKAATLILIDKVLFGYKWGYCPRGFLIDFNDFNLLETFTKLLREFLNKRNFIFVKIDPYIINKSRDKNGKPNGIVDNSKIINKLIELGYEHNGFNLNFENMKPRWNAVLTTSDNEDLFMRFNKEIRNKIRKADKMGVEVVKGTPDSIKQFYSLINKKHSRKLNYYLDMMEILGKKDMIEIYFAILNTAKYIEKSQELFHEEEKRNNEINQELEDNINSNNSANIIKRKMASDTLLNNYKQNIINATNLYKQYPEGIIIGTNAIIKYNNEIFFLIDGYKQEFKQFCPNHYIKYLIIDKYRYEGYTRMHLNGISGDFDNKTNIYYGLTRFKLGFSADIEEYIGEFTLVINKRKYNTFNKLNPIRNWLKQPIA
ncbi:MAG: peptidoglycan bridge formation glycyltransferase FemA/FemB family protein [Bacilli bacterium]|nr:peptidoglycan bridge formation glycyltransferase FemA/FemB family protein [Bacilli bacterium]